MGDRLEVTMTQANATGDSAALRAVYDSVVRALAGGQKPAAVEKQLMKRGMPPESARQLVGEASAALDAYRKSPEGRQAMAKRYRGRMVRGLLWAVGGLVVTAITYAMASDKGGSYYIFWGAVLFGAIDFFAGFVGWLRHQSEV
jgi:hypothetical protein